MLVLKSKKQYIQIDTKFRETKAILNAEGSESRNQIGGLKKIESTCLTCFLLLSH